MAIEAGGKNGVIPADDITTDYVDARNAGNKPYEIFHADSNVRLCAFYFSCTGLRLHLRWNSHNDDILFGTITVLCVLTLFK